MPPIAVQALVEVAPNGDGELPTGLLALAYRASRGCVVALALNGVAPNAIDRVLDPVVAAGDLDFKGVWYLDIGDQATIATVGRAAEVIVASSTTFAAQLAAFGLPWLPLELGQAWFAQRLGNTMPPAALAPGIRSACSGRPTNVSSTHYFRPLSDSPQPSLAGARPDAALHCALDTAAPSRGALPIPVQHSKRLG